MLRERVVSDFLLNQLHALIRAPFELLSDYCEDYDKKMPSVKLGENLRKQEWYYYTKLIRNAISHNFCFDFSSKDIERMPITWNGITITPDLQGRSLTHESFWHKPGYQLFLEMQEFAKVLPEPTHSNSL